MVLAMSPRVLLSCSASPCWIFTLSFTESVTVLCCLFISHVFSRLHFSSFLLSDSSSLFYTLTQTTRLNPSLYTQLNSSIHSILLTILPFNHCFFLTGETCLNNSSSILSADFFSPVHFPILSSCPPFFFSLQSQPNLSTSTVGSLSSFLTRSLLFIVSLIFSCLVCWL